VADEILGEIRTCILQILSVAYKNVVKHKKTQCSESANELYRPRDPRLSAKLESTFADRGMLRSQCSGSPTAVI
jgi:hypothetical protein